MRTQIEIHWHDNDGPHHVYIAPGEDATVPVVGDTVSGSFTDTTSGDRVEVPVLRVTSRHIIFTGVGRAQQATVQLWGEAE